MWEYSFLPEKIEREEIYNMRDLHKEAETMLNNMKKATDLNNIITYQFLYLISNNIY